MPTNAQVLSMKVDQYNKILECIDEHKTVAQIVESLSFSKPLVQYYLERLCKSSYKTGEPMVTRIKSNKYRTEKNILLFAYKRNVQSITFHDLVDPVALEKARPLLEAKNKIEKAVKDIGEEKISHIRVINMLSEPTEKQRQSLKAQSEMMRKENRNKSAVSFSGNSVLDSIFV